MEQLDVSSAGNRGPNRACKAIIRKKMNRPLLNIVTKGAPFIIGNVLASEEVGSRDPAMSMQPTKKSTFLGRPDPPNQAIERHPGEPLELGKVGAMSRIAAASSEIPSDAIITFRQGQRIIEERTVL